MTKKCNRLGLCLKKGVFPLPITARQAVSDQKCLNVFFSDRRTRRHWALTEHCVFRPVGTIQILQKWKFMSFSKFSREREQMSVFIDTLITQHPYLFEADSVPIHRKRSVNRPPAKNLRGTPWGRIIRDPEVRDPSSRLGRLFRLHFRMPFDLFEEGLVPLVRGPFFSLEDQD